MKSNELLPRKIIILCETNKRTSSDFIYIDEITNYYYKGIIKSNKISIDYIPMSGKHNYNNNKTIRSINEVKRIEKNIKVIYVFDKDDDSTSPTDRDFVKDVTTYCNKLGYGLVWFVKDVEEVMIGRQISKNKTQTANEFKKNGKIRQLQTKILSNPNPQFKRGSNVLCILKEILGKPEK